MLFKLWLADDMLMSHAGSSGNSEYCVAGTWVLEKKKQSFSKNQHLLRKERPAILLCIEF